MTDLATLGIRVDASGAIQDVDRLDRALIKVSATADQSVQYVRGLGQAATTAGRQMGLMELEAMKMDAAMRANATSTAAHGLQLGRLRQELGTLVGRVTETSGAMDRMGAAIGAMGLGDPLMIGVLAGLAAVATGYKLLSEQGKEAAEQAKNTAAEFKKIADLGVAQQAAKAGVLYSGDKSPGADPYAKLSIPQLTAELKTQQDVAEHGTRLNAEGLISYTKQAKAALENEKAINAELTRRRDLLASITGAGGSLADAAAKQIASDQPGFTTDAQREQEKADKLAHDEEVRRAKEIAKIRSDAVEAMDREQRKRLEGVRALQAEEESTARLAAAIQNGADAYKAQQDAETVAQLVRKAGIAIGDEEYDETVRAATAVVTHTRAIKDASEAQQQITHDLDEFARAQEHARAAAKQYADDMSKIWSHGIDSLVTHGLDSFQSFFETTFQMFTRLIERMAKEGKDSDLLGGLTAALGGGLTGYQLGRSGGAGTGVFGGALGGALTGNQYLPGMGAVIGGLAGAAAGLFGASSAQKEAAAKQEAAAAALQLAAAGAGYRTKDSLNAFVNAANGDDEASQIKAITDQATQLFADISAAILAGSSQFDQRDLDALNAATAKHIQAIKDETAARAAAVATATQRANEDLQVRLLRASHDDQGATDLAFELAQRREMEDAMAKLGNGTSDATIEILKQVQAAEKLAKAAADAAEAQAKQLAQTRASEDLDVEILNAKGETGKAADLQFQLEQQRRLEDAQKNQSGDYVKKLLELQQLQRDQRAAQDLIDSTGSGSRASRGASAAAFAVQSSVTERTAYELVDVGRAQLSVQRQLLASSQRIERHLGGRGFTDSLEESLSSSTTAADLFGGNVRR